VRLKLLAINWLILIFFYKFDDKDRFLGVDSQAWDGLKETAGNSSQIRHHVGAVSILC
jgi:hypothetical protein